MTHKERMAALVEAGEKAQMGGLYTRPPGHAEDEASLWEEHTGSGIARSFTCAPSDLRRLDFFAQAANARPSIALALEIVEAARECRRLDKAKLDFSETGEAAYFATAHARLDALLERWEGKE